MAEIQVNSDETGPVAPGFDKDGNKVDADGKVIEPNPVTVDPETGEPIQEETPATKPDWCPDKFWNEETGQVNQEDLAKSYASLESKLGQPQKKDGDSDDQSLDVPVQEKAEEVLKKAGLEYEDLSKEYWENGKLSDETYSALENAGIPKNIVDDFITGQEARASIQINEVKGLVGGKEAYADMTDWAANNLSDTEIEAFNINVNSGNPEQVKLAVQGLQAKYKAAVGDHPNLQLGDGATQTGASFKSWAEVTKAMKDERYEKDPAYRSEVQAKIARSKLD